MRCGYLQNAILKGCYKMGIRLYFRKKDIESEEFCLGKLFNYLDYPKQYETLESVCFLRDVRGCDDLIQEVAEYEYDKDPEECEESYMELFGIACEFWAYHDYGEFFQLTKAKAREFIRRYLQDHARVWCHEYWSNTEQCAMDFMQRMSSSEKSVFEFRLGA